MQGKVLRWLGGYGFIGSEDYEEDVFVHHSDLSGRDELSEGDVVEFDLINTYKGPRAVNVEVVTE